MQHCFADNMVDRKLYVIVIVIASSYPGWIVSTCSNSRYSETLGLGLSVNFHFGGGIPE